MPSTGFLIYSGVMPLIKTFLTILFGYTLARRGLFPPAAARGASQVTMNIALPALIFSNIVPAFTPANVSAIGPLLLIAFVYVAMGFVMGFIIREICYVPRNFYQGIVVMTGTSNWGNLPTAVVLTVTQAPPFNPKTDPALGVSFVSIFIVAYNLVFFLMGAANTLAWDYLPGVPQAEAAELRVSWKEKPIGGWIARVLFKSTTSGSGKNMGLRDLQIGGVNKEILEDIEQKLSAEHEKDGASDEAHPDPDVQLDRHTSRPSVSSFRSRPASVPHLPTSAGFPEAPPAVPTDVPRTTAVASLSFHVAKFLPPSLFRMFPPLSAVLTPINLTLCISLPIALIQHLKALFVDTTSLGGPNWKGPDGRPPLYFAIDTASFVGGICVPMALILLGASFARLAIPRPISRLAIPAMLSVALAKMFVLPIIGVLMVQAMVKGGLIPRENKTEIFVAMFLSGTPAAVNQLIVTQLYAPDGNVDTLSAFLLVQYVLMFFSSAALTAVALSLL